MNVQEFEAKHIFITDEFFEAKFSKIIHKEMPDNDKFLKKAAVLAGSYAETYDLINLYGKVLPNLSFEQEQFLFKKINYCRMKIEQSPNSSKKYLKIFIQAQNTICMCYIRSAIKYSPWKISFDSVPAQYKESKMYDFRVQVISENYNALLNCIPRFDWRRGLRFSTYMYTAFQRSAKGRVHSFNRNRAHQFDDEIGDFIVDKNSLDNSESNLDYETVDLIKKAITTLKPEAQEIFLKRYIDKKTTVEIAKEYSLSKQGVSFGLKISRSRIIRYLQEHSEQSLGNLVA